jgi:hypothetical protein
MKVIIILGVLAILGALASAGVFMLRRPDAHAKGTDKRMAWALALRVAISVTLFGIILLAWSMGWISPKGIPTAG